MKFKLQNLFLPFFLVCLSFLILTLNLGNQSLFPWDEAWYASIARNVIRSGNFLDLNYNGSPYWDHPPLGFWSIALSFKLLGISEFSARLPMVLFASLSVAIIFLIGKKLKDSWVGLSTALILFSSRWFLFRARSANLDILLLLCQLLVFYFSYNPKRLQELYLLWLFFCLGLLTKSVIMVTLLPLVVFGTYQFIKKHPLQKIEWFWLSVIFILPLLSWYGFNSLEYGLQFLTRNFLVIGIRGGQPSGISWSAFSQTKLYFRSAVHKWYWPFLFSLPASILMLKNKAIKRSLAYLVLVSFPYLLSAETQIWHLIPLIGPMALLISLVFFEMADIFLRFINKTFKWLLFFPKVILLTIVFLIAISSLVSYWSSIFAVPKIVSNEARLAMIAKEFGVPLLVEDKTYLPAVVFYADKEVKLVYNRHAIEDQPRPFQLLTRDFLISGLSDYKIISQVGDYVLVLFE